MSVIKLESEKRKEEIYSFINKKVDEFIEDRVVYNSSNKLLSKEDIQLIRDALVSIKTPYLSVAKELIDTFGFMYDGDTIACLGRIFHIFFCKDGDVSTEWYEEWFNKS
jgi:hypothetical protein